jgi:hypothetical protein
MSDTNVKTHVAPPSLIFYKLSVAPATPTTAALTFALPNNVYAYGTLVSVPAGASFVPCPSSTSRTTAYPSFAMISSFVPSNTFANFSNVVRDKCKGRMLTDDSMSSCAPARVRTPSSRSCQKLLKRWPVPILNIGPRE